ELMLDAFNLDGGDGSSFDRGEEGAAQGVSYRGTEPSLKGLRREAAITFSKRFCIRSQTARHLEPGPEIVLIPRHRFASRKKCIRAACVLAVETHATIDYLL